jgi:hypothetical protein
MELLQSDAIDVTPTSMAPAPFLHPCGTNVMYGYITTQNHLADWDPND